MSEENNDLEIEALSDEDLEEVAGGADECHETSCSKSDCSGGGNDTLEMDMSIRAR